MNNEIERLPYRLEFAHALELVMRRLQQPYVRTLDFVQPEDLGLPSSALVPADPMLAYRYVHGLNIEGEPQVVRGREAWWCRGHRLGGSITALAELRPGLLALATGEGAVHFAGASRGEWEVLETLNAGARIVNHLQALGDGELLVLASDGFVGVVDCDSAGRWRCRPVAWSVSATTRFDPKYACDLGEGHWLVGGSGGIANVRRLPSGEWSAAWQSHGDLHALLALGGGRWLTWDGASQAPPMVHELVEGGGSTGRALPVGMDGGLSAVASWDGGRGLLLGSSSGKVWRLDEDDVDRLLAGRPTEAVPSSMSATAINFLQALPGGLLLTGHSDGQHRLWRDGGQGAMVLQADLGPSPMWGGRAFASLCDGRVVRSSGRGIFLLGPDSGGVWREERLTLDSIHDSPGPRATLLGERTIAFIDGLRLVWIQVDGLDVRMTATQSVASAPTQMVAVDDELLVVLHADGALHSWARQGDQGQWAPSVLAPAEGSARPGMPLTLIASGSGHLVRVMYGVAPNAPTPELQMFRRETDAWLPVDLPPLPSDVHGICRGAAVAGRDSLAIEVEEQVWVYRGGTWVQPPGLPARTWAWNGLHAIDTETFIVVDDEGQGRVVSASGQHELTLGRISGSGPMRTCPAVPPRSTKPYMMAMSRGSSGLMRPHVSFGAPHLVPPSRTALDVRGPITHMHARGMRIAVSAGRLYLVDMDAPDAEALRSISVEGGVAVACYLAPDGHILRLRARRLDGRSWTTRLANGRAEPDDPLLARQVALLGADGRLVHVARGLRYTFSEDRTVFQAEGEA